MIVQRPRSGAGREELSCTSRSSMSRPARGVWVRLTITLLMACALPPASSGAGAEPDSSSWKIPAEAPNDRNPLQPNANSLTEGKKLFQQECVTCHGSAGKGDGPKAKSLKVTPTDLSDPKIGQQSDGVLGRKITEGKTPMPSYGSKLSKHE